MNVEELYSGTLDYNLRDDPVQGILDETEVLLQAIDRTLDHLRQLVDGEGISEMERLRRRVAVLEALLAREEGA